MRDTKLAPSAAQLAAIIALEALTDPARDITVEAWAMPEPAVDLCANGGDCHEIGRCYFPNGEEGLCVAATLAYLEANLVDGSWISVDVAR
jgi:hypothetical protein